MISKRALERGMTGKRALERGMTSKGEVEEDATGDEDKRRYELAAYKLSIR